MLRIAMLGGLRVYEGERPLPPFPTQKTLSLFSYLVTFRYHYHARDTLANLFWNDTPGAQARRNLNTTVWRLRRNLPPGYLQAESSTLAFDPTEPYWLDVAEFEAELEQAGLVPADDPFLPRLDTDRIQRALDLYQGDFMGGWPEDWALAEAERLRLLYLQALHRLLLQHRADGEYEQALSCAQRLLEVDPLREEAYRQAMELYSSLGRRGEALELYASCRRLLQEELGVSPLPETVTLYEQIRAAEQRQPSLLPITAAPTPLRRPTLRTPLDSLGRAPLIGRKREWGWLAARLEEAVRGQGNLVMIEGEAGVGKTRLVQEVVRYAERHGCLVLRGVCQELKEPPPYLPWVQALRRVPALVGREKWAGLTLPGRAEISALLPELRPGRPGPSLSSTSSFSQQQARLFLAVSRLLASLGQIQPCLLVLEDLQWADQATLEMLAYTARHIGRSSLLIIGTARSEEIAAPQQDRWDALERDGALQRMALHRLSEADTARLVAETLGWPVPDPRIAGRLYDETQGNPFFLIETLQGLLERGVLAPDENGLWQITPMGQEAEPAQWLLPQGVRQAVKRRLEPLDKQSRYLLELAAVLGNEFELELLRSVSGWKKEVVLQITDDLLRRQLLLEQDRLCFSHDKIRQVIYQEIDEHHRRALHLRAGAVLARLAPGRTEELANHFYQGQDDRRAMPYCLEAGRRAWQVYAHQSALNYLTWTAEAAQRIGGIESRQVLLEAYEVRGQVYESFGSYPQAMENYAAMEETARIVSDHPSLARAIRRQAWVWGERMGQWEKGLSGAYEALRIAREAGSQSEATFALLDIGALHNMRGEHGQALDSLRSALAAAEEDKDQGARAASLQYLAVTYQFLSRYEEGADAFQEAFRTWSRLGNRREAAKTLADLGFLQINWGALAKAEQALQQAVDELVAIEATGALPFVRVGLAALQRYTGRCSECLQTLQDIEQSLAPGDSPFVLAMILYHRAWALWDQGQVGPALAELQQGLLRARQSGSPTQVAGFLDSLGRYHRCLGQANLSQRYFQEALDLNRQAAFTSGEAAARAGLGLALVGQGNIEQGWLSLKEAANMARPLGPLPYGEMSTALAEGALAMGIRPACLRLARRSLSLAEQVGLRPLQVQAGSLLSRTLAGLGRLPEAERALHRVLQETERPGYPMQRWQLLLVLSNVLAELGRTEESAQARAQAVDTVQSILASMHDEPLRASFLSQPPIQYLLGQPPSSQENLVLFKVARLGVPGGRPLHPDEWVTIPLAKPLSATTAGRRRAILRLVDKAWLLGGCPSEADLGAALGVSTRTIRSDIAALRRKGYAVRTRGGRKLEG